MNKDQIDETNMLQTTNLILTTPANEAIYSGFTAFVRSQAALDSSINLLSALAQAQGSPLTGITLDKERLKLSLVARLVIVAGAAGACGPSPTRPATKPWLPSSTSRKAQSFAHSGLRLDLRSSSAFI